MRGFVVNREVPGGAAAARLAGGFYGYVHTSEAYSGFLGSSFPASLAVESFAAVSFAPGSLSPG